MAEAPVFPIPEIKDLEKHLVRIFILECIFQLLHRTGLPSHAVKMHKTGMKKTMVQSPKLHDSPHGTARSPHQQGDVFAVQDLEHAFDICIKGLITFIHLY